MKTDATALLTRTERDIAAYLCRGMSVKKIARRRGIKKRTVDSHLFNIYKKLRLKSKLEQLKEIFNAE